MIEKIVHKNLHTAFFEEDSVLDEREGGFSSGHCTTSTIAKLTDDLYHAINKRETTIATFIDLRKAFDTVEHTILLTELEKLGVRALPYRWLSSYLENRKQATTANNTTSSRMPLQCGVPQGSIFGPLLFLVYVNDMGKVLENCKFQLYANDTVQGFIQRGGGTGGIYPPHDFGKGGISPHQTAEQCFF